MYRTTDTSVWRDPKFRKLPPITKAVFHYLWTNDHSHVSGIYYLPDGTIEHEYGWSSQEVEEALLRLESEKFIIRDREREIVFVRSMLKRQVKKSGPTILTAVAKQLTALDDSPLISIFIETYPTLSIPYPIPHIGPIATLHTPYTPSHDPTRIQPDQEMYQEMEQNQKNSSLPSSSSSGGKRDDKRKLPLLKKIPDLETALKKINLESFRMEWEPKGLDVDACFKKFSKYVLEGSPEKPYPNPSKWRDFPAAFRNSCQSSIEKGYCMIKTKSIPEPQPSDLGKKAAKALLSQLEANGREADQDRQKAETLWQEINSLPSDEIQTLRQKAIQLAKETAPNVKLSEFVVKMTMIKLFKENPLEYHDIFAESG